MPDIIITSQFILQSSVANAATFAIAYPAGETQASMQARSFDTINLLSSGGRTYTGMTASYGAGSITLTNGSGYTLPAGTYYVEFANPVEADDAADGRPLAKFTIDTSGNVTGLVGPNGKITLDEFVETTPASAQILAAAVQSDWSMSTLPTPYAAVAGHVLHASPLYFPGGFGGYKYWVAYTPYPNGDAAYENPCIAASNDFDTWVLPTNAPNPLVERPTAPGYNSDTNLFYDAPTKKLVVLWRERNAAGNNLNILKLITSSDGVAWSSPVSIWSGSITNNDMASPSLYYDTAASKYVIIAHNLDDAARPIRKITSDSLLSGWDVSPAALTFSAPAGRKWWHSQFLYVAGAVIGVAQDNDGTVGASGKLYFVYSADGSTFHYRLFDANTTWYKPGVLLRKLQDGKPLLQLMLSKPLSSVVYTATATIRRGTSLAAEVNALGSALQLATSAPSSVLWGDDFNRTDSSSAIGTALSGGSYTQHGAGGDVIGINTNRAYNATSNNCRASADVLAADYEARVVFASPGSQGFLMFRFTDTSNFFRVGNTILGGNLVFQEITAGSITTSTEISSTVVAAGDIVTVRCIASLIQVLHNGALVYEAHDASNLSASKVGIQASGATATYFDALTVTRLWLPPGS